MNVILSKRIGALLAAVVLAAACGGDAGDGGGGGGGGPEGLHAYVVLPEGLENGGAAGFGRTVEGITVNVVLDGAAVSADRIDWFITEGPTAADLSDDSGSTTSFAIPTFEEVREGANGWINDLYGTTDTEHEFEYIQAPEREQLLSFGPLQVQAMSYRVAAQVRVGSQTTWASALVSPVSVSNGGNTLPLGSMVVANAPSDGTYAWTLTYLPTTAAADATFGPPPAGVALQGADTKNPNVLPTVTGFYRLQNGTNEPISFRVSTYHGAGRSAADEGPDGVACADCHRETPHGNFTLTQFTEWAASPHMNHEGTGMPLFQLGITGALGPNYSERALASHVVGYNRAPAARDAGFDDVMGSWSLPVPASGNWDALPAALKHRAGVQCESCHGPLEPTDHSMVGPFGHGPIKAMASMDAGVCMSCHDAFDQDQGTLWSTAAHANTQLAIDDGSVENRGLTASVNTQGVASVSGVVHCGRCHAAEGFALYLEQQQGRTCETLTPALTAGAGVATGRAGYIRPRVVEADGSLGACYHLSDHSTTPPTVASADTLTAAKAYFSKMGMGAANVHSVTCQTCHDPHSTELRLTGDTNVTAASFNYRGAGTGAICIVCHNSRIGDPIYSDSSKTSYSAPHAAAQGDIFAGRNAYFYGQAASGASMDVLDYKHSHPNACAGCHVKWVPEDVKAQFGVLSSNHTFKASLEGCTECHGEGYGEQIAHDFEQKMTTLANALATLFMNKMNVGGLDSMDRYEIVTSATGEDSIGETKLAAAATAAGSVQSVSLSEFHGQPAFIVTLTDGTTRFGNNIGSFKLAGAALFPGNTASGSLMAKAFYNYLLLHGGAGEGVHNPSFANGVLDATITQVGTIPSL